MRLIDDTDMIKNKMREIKEELDLSTPNDMYEELFKETSSFYIKELEKTIKKVTEQRDAALDDLYSLAYQTSNRCNYCKYKDCGCDWCSYDSDEELNFVWRGMVEEGKKVRLIDADVYEKILTEWMPDHQGGDDIENTVRQLLYDCIAKLQKMPTIDPERLRPQGRWISTNDVYPDLYQHVLICINLAGNEKLVCEACLTDYFDRSYWRTIDTEIDDADLDEVTHWMPLPEPPKEA